MRRCPIVLLVVVCGCGSPAADLDAGTRDAAGRDALALDADFDASRAEVDAAVVPGSDAWVEDASATDAPRADALTGDAGSPAAEGCFTDVSAGHRVLRCEELDFDVEISSACAAGGCGLIFDVHGATMDAASEDRNTNLRALGAAAGYVVVQPTAPPGTIGPSWDPVRDDPKVYRFLELTMRALRIDPDRVHFTGFSQGGFMTWRMLCDHADVFASVAPAAACGALFRGCDFSGTARPSRELPVLYLHGTADIIVSGCSTAQRDAVVAGWAMTEDSVLSTDAAHRWTRYLSAAGTPFEFLSHDYVAYSYLLRGHCLPGSPDIGTSRFAASGYGCDATSPVTWGEAVLAFFVAHPR